MSKYPAHDGLRKSIPDWPAITQVALLKVMYEHDALRSRLAASEAMCENLEAENIRLKSLLAEKGAGIICETLL